MNEPLKLNTQCPNILLDFGVQLKVSGTDETILTAFHAVQQGFSMI
jgi:hypothetical protein